MILRAIVMEIVSGCNDTPRHRRSPAPIPLRRVPTGRRTAREEETMGAGHRGATAAGVV